MKQYLISFSESNEKIELTNKEGEITATKTVREMELAILENLFLLAMNSQKDMGKAFECRDCLEQARNIKEKKGIKLTISDIKYLKDAFEASAERRPSIWLDKCYDLFKQIKDPQEVKE